MKKILILAIACLTISQAKMFVGADGGYIMYGSASNGSTNSSIYDSKNKHRFDSDGWSVSLNFGAEGFVNNYFGARAFLEAFYSRGLNNSINIIDITGNADIIINFVNTGGFAFGAFGGLGVGYEYLFTNKFTTGDGIAPFFGRVGLTFGLGNNSRIDATLKLPIMGWYIHGSDSNKFVQSPLSFQLGYKYLF
ncbi:hypothetical protein [Helicobacter sp. MIT 14-3879]|uniref:hypothetical protein n=1 Tax=Helicobacter sp. MIT 14-3879 TaxID=2040649 RepID=UPI000E1ED870|nr:hypothetical protein [Helicobacter sp. MIT 14-3879]RDU65130.1 hypothetical protein CQA44_02115 [Helicobacter sp. MIT 14-3879]